MLKISGDPKTAKLRIARDDDTAVFGLDVEEVPELLGMLLAAAVCVKSGKDFPPTAKGKPVTFQ
jgi:hypothetical protein